MKSLGYVLAGAGILLIGADLIGAFIWLVVVGFLVEELIPGILLILAVGAGGVGLILLAAKIAPDEFSASKTTAEERLAQQDLAQERSRGNDTPDEG